MAMSFRRLLIPLLTVMLLTLPGCIDRFTGEGTDPSSVKVITPEEIDSIFEALSQEITEKYPVETDNCGNYIVYWLEGGTVWHVSNECNSVKSAEKDKVFSGTESEAIACGKERVCKICSKNLSYDPPDSISETVSVDVESTDFDESAVAYWLPGGSVWHKSKFCRALAKSDQSKILSGSVNEAYNSGKTRACKLCAEESEESESNSSESTTVVQETTEKYQREYTQDGELLVFWLESGSVWHESRYCVSLSKAEPDRLLSGTEADAKSSGKERACKNCS